MTRIVTSINWSHAGQLAVIAVLVGFAIWLVLELLCNLILWWTGRSEQSKLDRQREAQAAADPDGYYQYGGWMR